MFRICHFVYIFFLYVSFIYGLLTLSVFLKVAKSLPSKIFVKSLNQVLNKKWKILFWYLYKKNLFLYKPNQVCWILSLKCFICSIFRQNIWKSRFSKETDSEWVPYPTFHSNFIRKSAIVFGRETSVTTDLLKNKLSSQKQLQNLTISSLHNCRCSYLFIDDLGILSRVLIKLFCYTLQ